MTIEQILEDIKSDRKKKAILDGDIAIEMDDQYAIGYCIGSDKIDILSFNAGTFGKGVAGDYVAGTEACYNEILRVLKACGKEGRIPAYHGAPSPIMYDPNFGPVYSDAAWNIVRTVKESDEIVYILSTGCCTNVVSAYLIDPTIKENSCVIWLGGNCFGTDPKGECNLEFDYAAGQLLLDLDIPLVMLPAYYDGTFKLEVLRDDLNAYLPGDSSASVFFRDTLPDQFQDSVNEEGVWWRVLFDLAAPGVLAVPHGFKFSIIPAPIITDDGKYAFDKTRHKIIYMEDIDREIVLDDAFKSIRSI